MKTKLSLLLGAFSLVSITGAIAQTAVTDPVGYITHAIAGNSAGGASGAATFISSVLVQPVSFTGTSTADPSGSNTVSFASGVPTNLDSSYIVEIKSATREGWWAQIASSTATSITTAGATNAFPASLGGPISVNVRKITTLKDFLGANTIGLAALDGVNTVADEVQMLNPVTQVATIAIYATAAGGAPVDGWYDAVSLDSLDAAKLFPGTAVKVKRFGSDGTSFVSVGHVKLTKTEVDIFPNVNWVAPVLAVGGNFGGNPAATTVQSMNIASALVKELGASPSLADQIQVINPNQTTDFFLSPDASLGAGTGIFDAVSLLDSNAKVITEGSGFIVRRPSAVETTWVVPAQTVSQN